jgi:hypothetical protein
MGRSEYVQRFVPLGSTDGERSIQYLHYFLAEKNTND